MQAGRQARTLAEGYSSSLSQARALVPASRSCLRECLRAGLSRCAPSLADGLGHRLGEGLNAAATLAVDHCKGLQQEASRVSD